jgi:hypothetical protein
MMGPFMRSPLDVSRGAEDVEPTIDDDQRFVWNFPCPPVLQKQTYIEQAVKSEMLPGRDIVSYPTHPLWGIIVISGALMGGDSDGSQVVDQGA